MAATETWRPVPGFEGLYSVSDLGRVFSHRAGRCLRPGPQAPCGHLSVVLGRGNTRLVHLLVLTTFVGPRPPRLVCRHLDGDERNNRLSNLEWATRRRNGQDKKWHKGQSTYKLSPDQVKMIKGYRIAGHSVAYLAGLFAVSRGTIYALLSGKNHADVLL